MNHKKTKVTQGVKVRYCGHMAFFIADVYEINGAVVVRPPTTPLGECLIRDPERQREATHHVSDFPDGAFWRPDLGVLVVPKTQFRKLTARERRLAR